MPRLAKREAKRARTPETPANARTAMLIAFALFLAFESEGLRHFTRDTAGQRGDRRDGGGRPTGGTP